MLPPAASRRHPGGTSSYGKIPARGRIGFDGSRLPLEGMSGATPPVIGVEQDNCQHAVCSRCLIQGSASPSFGPPGRERCRSCGLGPVLPA
jgi:hypothetical protein